MKHIKRLLLVVLSLLLGVGSVQCSTIFNRAQVTCLVLDLADNDYQMYACLMHGLTHCNLFAGQHVFAQLQQNLSNEWYAQHEISDKSLRQSQQKKIGLMKSRLYRSTWFYSWEKCSLERLHVEYAALKEKKRVLLRAVVLGGVLTVMQRHGASGVAHINQNTALRVMR
jgi:hypothetical protein